MATNAWSSNLNIEYRDQNYDLCFIKSIFSFSWDFPFYFCAKFSFNYCKIIATPPCLTLPQYSVNNNVLSLLQMKKLVYNKCINCILAVTLCCIQNSRSAILQSAITKNCKFSMSSSVSDRLTLYNNFLTDVARPFF